MNAVATHISQQRPITGAEQRVLEWMYFGKTNTEIAQLLACSVFTVKNHIHSLCRKLSVENRTRLVTLALERGLLKIPKGEEKT